MINKSLPDDTRLAYTKWLQLYWNYCLKYQHDPLVVDSFRVFLAMLSDKQPESYQVAHQALALFYVMQTANRNIANDVTKQFQEHVALTHVISSATGTSWVFVFDQLLSEIKLRHYSHKTLLAYRFWIRQFQTFTKSKDYHLLSQQDVIDFLTFLAVKQQVSASSQNQAFNALLFLFRHVLKKEFGEIKSVPRAKRTRYIPVVLSREEIDLIFDHLADIPHPLGILLIFNHIFFC